MTHCVVLADGHQISDERARLDMGYVERCLATTYWGARRDPAVNARSWAHCLPFGIYAPGGQQVGFARLLTDYALRAHLGDVFVDPAARGRGLAKALMDVILGHPELATVDHWTLTTNDAQALYARYGFTLGEADGRWMVLNRGG